MNVQQAGWQPGRQAGWQTSRMAGRHKEQERSQDRVSPLTGGLLFNVQKGQGKLQNGCLHLIDFGKWRKIVSKTPRQSERRPSTGQNRNWITAGGIFGQFWPGAGGGKSTYLFLLAAPECRSVLPMHFVWRWIEFVGVFYHGQRLNAELAEMEMASSKKKYTHKKIFLKGENTLEYGYYSGQYRGIFSINLLKLRRD